MMDSDQSSNDNEKDSNRKNENDDDDIDKLKQRLAETEEKLVKFKTFVVTLRNERNQLKEKVQEDSCLIEKLKSQTQKQNSGQLFQNFQNLQNEYDKCQDEIDKYKKTSKTLEQDLIKSTQELTELRELCVKQKDEIKSLKNHISFQDSQIETQKEAIRDFDSKVIVLETRLGEQQAKIQDYLSNEDETVVLRKELELKNQKINELSDQLLIQSDQMSIINKKIIEQREIIEKYAVLQEENASISDEIEQSRRIIANNIEEISKFNKKEEEFKFRIEELEKKIDEQQISRSEEVSSLQLEIYDLKNKLQSCEDDLKNNNFKFEEYKSKVTNVLKESKINNCDYSRNIEILNLKIENLQEENNKLRNECDIARKMAHELKAKNDSVEMQFSKMKNQNNDYDMLKQSFELLSTENDKLNSTIRELQISFAREKCQMIESHKDRLSHLKTEYESKLKELEEELARMRTNDRNLVNCSDDSNSVGNSNTSFEEIKDENSSTQSNVSSFEKNFLEEILSNESINSKSPVGNGLNVDNLTQLLAESENNISLLTEQNRVLKEEIRRLHRNIDRLDIANNLEYLKNVLLKFFTIKGHDERERLIGVLSTILKLSSEEVSIFHEFLPDHLNKSMTSKWNLWQWS